MKYSLLNSLLFLSFIILVSSCEKEPTRTQLYPYLKVKVNGKQQSIDACGTSSLVANYLSDTAIFSGIGCGGQGIGFYIKGRIRDGVYQLDHKNKAWYEENYITYNTDSLRKGTIIIRTKEFQAANGIIPYIEGEISFEAINQSTGKTIKLTGGKYKLQKYI